MSEDESLECNREAEMGVLLLPEGEMEEMICFQMMNGIGSVSLKPSSESEKNLNLTIL